MLQWIIHGFSTLRSGLQGLLMFFNSLFYLLNVYEGSILAHRIIC